MIAPEEAARRLIGELLVDPGPVARAAARLAMGATSRPIGVLFFRGSLELPGDRRTAQGRIAALLCDVEPANMPIATALAGAVLAAEAAEERFCNIALRQTAALGAIAIAREVFRVVGLRPPTDAELLTAAACTCETGRPCRERCGCPCHRPHEPEEQNR